jgi:hypothetical protein
VARDSVEAWLTRELKASWPENSTTSADCPVIWANPIARPPTARAATGSSSHGCLATTWADRRARSVIAKVTRAAANASTMAQPNSAAVNVENAGSEIGLST